MIIDDMAYVINVGDSRCIMSIDSGSQIAVLTRAHKPDDEQERIRIQAAGGKIYRTQTFAKAATSPDEKDLYVQGPLLLPLTLLEELLHKKTCLLRLLTCVSHIDTLGIRQSLKLT